ncbi:MAG: CPBP family intramembrane glutamic endopeptidase [Chloroflexota bacterium]
MLIPSIPGIDHVPDPLRVLMALGLAMLLVLLRLDAERFFAAEYNDIDRWGRRPSLLRRLAWYLLGLVGILAVLEIHPAPDTELFLGLGERLGAVILGLSYGAIGVAVAVGIALFRYQRVRFPTVTSYPTAILNSIMTAFIDEAVFRGILFGFLITVGIDANLANVAQAIIYALATRLGAPGRPWYMLVTALVIGLAGGWLTGITMGIGAAFLGHAITRVAIFVTTGHAGLPKARGTEDEEVARRRATPAGWQILDDSQAGDR